MARRQSVVLRCPFRPLSVPQFCSNHSDRFSTAIVCSTTEDTYQGDVFKDGRERAGAVVLDDSLGDESCM